jgi:hypothetical protein
LTGGPALAIRESMVVVGTIDGRLMLYTLD